MKYLLKFDRSDLISQHIYLNPLNIVWSVFNSIMLMFRVCSVGSSLLVSVLRLSSLMFERAFVGHRFDQDTPISETVRGYTSDIDSIS